jgi:hypothetical protein
LSGRTERTGKSSSQSATTAAGQNFLLVQQADAVDEPIMHAGKIDNVLPLSVASGLFVFRSCRVQRSSGRFQLGGFASERDLRCRFIGGGRNFAGHNATPDKLHRPAKGPNACIFIGNSWNSSGAVFVCLPLAPGLACGVRRARLFSIPLVRVPGLMVRPVRAGEVATGVF